MAEDSLKFVPQSSCVEQAFWAQLAARKLADWKLDESPQPVHGYYVNSTAPGLDSVFCLDHTSLAASSGAVPRRAVVCNGRVHVFNLKSAFLQLDRRAVLAQFADQLIDQMRSFAADTTFAARQLTMNPFLLTAYIDLKKHHFTYWMCYPALNWPSVTTTGAQQLNSCFAGDTAERVGRVVLDFCEAQGWPAAFVLHCGSDGQPVECRHWTPAAPASFQSQTDLLVFADPSSIEGHPGWPLRNILALYHLHNKQESSALRVLGLRLQADAHSGAIQLGNSWVWHVSLAGTLDPQSATAVGWEKNPHGKLAPHFVDLSAAMDKKKLASSAVDLNLNLMRWRLLPEIDLDKMRSLRCLLFGAGTLGCYVARALLAWGVRHITFVDSGTVSYSNPVRQSLYTFDDSCQGDRPKAVAAAEAVQRIQPAASSEGHVVHVPMPGHVVADSEASAVSGTVSELDGLVASHDAVFLLTDSREGRWLPALMANWHNKLCVSAALGFDSYVVMRHGTRASQPQPGASASGSGVLPGNSLGCYFCSDVTAPGNSTADRTVDQQCTVTRPGVALIASGLATELLASVVQHPLYTDAPAQLQQSSGDILAENTTDGETAGCLGIVPHQIRGHTWRFTQMCCAVRRFDSCIACSHKVVSRYGQDGPAFVLQVCNDPTFLEQVTGLTQLQATVDDLEIWDFDDSQSVTSME